MIDREHHTLASSYTYGMDPVSHEFRKLEEIKIQLAKSTITLLSSKEHNFKTSSQKAFFRNSLRRSYFLKYIQTNWLKDVRPEIEINCSKEE
jgi:hypothetical protein